MGATGSKSMSKSRTSISAAVSSALKVSTPRLGEYKTWNLEEALIYHLTFHWTRGIQWNHLFFLHTFLFSIFMLAASLPGLPVLYGWGWVDVSISLPVIATALCLRYIVFSLVGFRCGAVSPTVFLLPSLAYCVVVVAPLACGAGLCSAYLRELFSGAAELAPCALALVGVLLSFFAQLAGHASEEKWQAAPYLLHGFVDAPILEWLCTWHGVRALAALGADGQGTGDGAPGAGTSQGLPSSRYYVVPAFVPDAIVHIFRTAWGVRHDALSRCAQILAGRERGVQVGAVSGGGGEELGAEMGRSHPPPSPSFAMAMRPLMSHAMSPILRDDNGYGTSIPTLALPPTLASGDELGSKMGNAPSAATPGKGIAKSETSPLLRTALPSSRLGGTFESTKREASVGDFPSNSEQADAGGPRAAASSLLVGLGLGPVLGLSSYASRQFRARTGSGTSDGSQGSEEETMLLHGGANLAPASFGAGFRWGANDKRQEQLRQMQRIVYEQRRISEDKGERSSEAWEATYHQQYQSDHYKQPVREEDVETALARKRSTSL